MTYSNEEITRRLQLGEDSAWEFKQVEFAGDRPRSPRRDDLADEIAAFAREQPGLARIERQAANDDIRDLDLAHSNTLVDDCLRLRLQPTA